MTRQIFRATLVSLCLFGSVSAVEAKSFTVTEVTLKDPTDGGTLQTSQLEEFFNRARCLCKTEVPVQFRLSIDQSGDSKPVTAVAGVGDCLTTEGDIDCTEPKPFPLANMEGATDDTIDATLPANELMDDVDCSTTDDDELTLAIFFEDQGDWQKLGNAEATYRRDIQPPNPPTVGSDPKGGDGRVTVDFSVDSATKEDTRYYQLLCVEMNDDGTVKGPWGGNAQGAAFLTAEGLCGVSDTADGGTGTGDVADAGVSDAAVEQDASPSIASSGSEPERPAGLLNSSNNPYICSDRLTTDGSEAVSGLENGKTYGFWVVAIDLAQNPSEPRWLGTGTPVDVEDLWELYSRVGGQADGSYGCGLTCGGAWLGGILIVGLFALSTVWLRRRRTRRPRGRQA